MEVHKQGIAKAAAFSAAFAATLQTNDQAGQFFEDVALAPQSDRIAILEAQRAAGLSAATVQGIGLLPAAHGLVVMRDFLVQSGQIDHQALGSVMDWIAGAGKTIRERGIQIPDSTTPHDGWLDDFFDAIVDAAKAVVDAVVGAVGGLVEGLKQIAGWAADKVRDLVNGLLAAGRSLAEIVSDAIEASAAGYRRRRQSTLECISGNC